MYRINQKAVSDVVIKDALEFIDIFDYEVLMNKKEILRKELDNVTVKDKVESMQDKVRALVFGGMFRIYNDDIRDFLRTLNLHSRYDKQIEEEPMELYAKVMWHAIKRYVK